MIKKETHSAFLLVLVGAIIVALCSCAKEIQVELPRLTTNLTTEISSLSATSGGTVTNDGGAVVTSRGVCWSINQGPTTSDNKTVDGQGKGMFNSSLTGLLPGTTYYVKAYAVNSLGTAYGNQLQFQTQSALPVITMNLVMLVKDIMATCGAFIASDGGSPVTARGTCWSTNQNPTIADNKTSDGTGMGSYTSTLSELSPGTTYYAKAYATNSVGTAYSAQMTISTMTTIPSLTTNVATDIAETTATSGGNITMDGGAAITSRGVCWSTSQNPTVANPKTIDGSGNGSFTSRLSGMEPGTLYYIRAYAINSVGTAYGNQISITTKVAVPLLTTTALSAITSSSASGGGGVISNGGAEITAKGICWSTSQNPSISNEKTNEGSGSGNFTSSINDLISGETYYVRAYATNSVGTGYGNQLQFSTIAGYPVLYTDTPTSITITGALSGGNITSAGSSPVLFRGVCWSSSAKPTIFNNKTTDASGSGTFTSNITGLDYGTKYWLRAYAINSLGTSYGNEVTFTTLPNLATVTTTPITSVTKNSATSGGNIINDGRGSITARGICWSINHNPTVSDSKTVNGSAAGSFISTMNNLTQGTSYYVRAYATNSAGTAYGNEMFFTTNTALPTINTSYITDVTTTTALSGGEIVSYGEGAVLFRGLCWNSTPNPTISNQKTIIGSSIDSFTSIISGLIKGATYYVRAYATNEFGTAYGQQRILTTNSASIFDVDGNEYFYVIIGSQTWMTKNLKTTRYRNGDLIGTTNPSILDISSESTPKYQWAYGGDESNVSVYGRLYSKHAATDNRNICPVGWHVPTYGEWLILIEYLGGHYEVGKKIKEAGTTHWLTSSSVVTNESGFTAIPGGFRGDVNFSTIREWCVFWALEGGASSSESLAFTHSSNISGTIGYYPNRKLGLSVRCIKD